MSQAPTIEDRVSELEKEMAEVKRRLDSDNGDVNWIDRMSGSFANDPEFEEVVRLGAEIRRKMKKPQLSQRFMYLFDTDHLVILQAQTAPEFTRLKRRMARHAPRDFYVSIVSFHEQVLGWHTYLQRAKKPPRVVYAYDMFHRLVADYTNLQVLKFDDAASTEFESLRKQRIRIGTMDLRIAAIAITRGLTVLSRNLSDFQQVPGLSVQDWTT